MMMVPYNTGVAKRMRLWPSIAFFRAKKFNHGNSGLS